MNRAEPHIPAQGEAEYIHPLALREQFDTVDQQRDASTLGMWIFLITEVMFFGGMFLAYSIYRTKFPEVFAVASTSLNVYIGAHQHGRASVLQFHHGHGGTRLGARKAKGDRRSG